MELAELFAELLADVLTEILTAGVLVELASGTELKAQVKIQQPKELKVLLMAVRY